MNKLAIDLNNNAVVELQSGNLYKAMESISLACTLMVLQGHDHNTTALIDPTSYIFNWSDCSPEALNNRSNQADSPHDNFLYLSFLVITLPEESKESENSEKFCPCAFAWAILYNMSLIFAITGIMAGVNGTAFLQCAGSYLNQVKIRTDSSDATPSQDWSRLQIAVLNNQICISSELCMHTQAKKQIIEMRQRLLQASVFLESHVLEEFTLNLQCLHGTGDLALAA